MRCAGEEAAGEAGSSLESQDSVEDNSCKEYLVGRLRMLEAFPSMEEES